MNCYKSQNCHSHFCSRPRKNEFESWFPMNLRTIFMLTNMKFVTILFFTLGVCFAEDKFDPVTFDYCPLKSSKKCKENAPHSACNCTANPPHSEVLEDIVNFRQLCIDQHNKWRDFVASGESSKQNKFVPAAANMLVLNYDLELEYIARCLASNSYVEDHDKCRVDHKGNSVGQNLAGHTEIDLAMTILIKQWYDEFVDIEAGQIARFPGHLNSKNKIIGHFTQMMWGEASLVGCARSWNPTPSPPHTGYKSSIICNYHSIHKKYGGNTITLKVYEAGDAGSKCPDGYPSGADPKYPSLCGKTYPVPKDMPPLFDKYQTGDSDKSPIDQTGASARIWQNDIILFLAILILVLFY